jgi:hypothetical protein
MEVTTVSRHRIAEKPNEIVVGWDPPLQTFFLQILDPEKDEEEEIVLWLGARHGELQKVDDLAAALAPYASLTPELAQQLEAEKAGSTMPSPLQLSVIEMFSPVSKE